jgi:hypothetical protein
MRQGNFGTSLHLEREGLVGKRSREPFSRLALDDREFGGSARTLW